MRDINGKDSRRKIFLMAVLLLTNVLTLMAQHVVVAGKIFDEETKKPVEFASVMVKDGGQWAITDAEGRFAMKNVPVGKLTLTVQCLGYSTRAIPLNITKDMDRLRIPLKQESLKIDEVTVVAKRKNDELTTSYAIDKTALDNQQILNLADVSTLLPGGKTVNPSLMNDDRMALRSGAQEMGNASFGTAIEVDGVRLSNNAMVGETMAASTRNMGVSNIESVEVVTGIPSVEYGDLSNGVVKVNTRKGKSPFVLEGRLTQHTRQISLSKGFDLGTNKGVLNASFEHARSFSDAASPYTAYQRNQFSFNYMNVLMRHRMPLTLNVGFSGNVGGYRSKADPDEELDRYSRVRDNVFRGFIDMQWLLNKKWITNLSFKTSLSYADRRQEAYEPVSSVGTQPLIHSMSEGYFMAEDYDVNPYAPIILGPTGYWYEQSFVDSKPLDFAIRLKADWTRRFGKVLSSLKVGAEFTSNKNNGRGRYYADMRYATNGWREDRYDSYPAMKNLAFYVEEKATLTTSKLSQLELTAGLREDLTMISGSEYGTVGSFSPRFNARYVFWRNQRKRWVTDLDIHAGWGKSVKLPSFQVLYPSYSYADKLAFSSPSTATNTSFYAYYTHPSKAVYNPDLKWQYTNQTDIGIDMNIKGTKISLSAFHHRTYHPYMAESVFTPYTYYYTAPEALNGLAISEANRIYQIHQQTGVVTVSDATGVLPSVELANTARRTYLTNTRYVNASPLDRYGLEWIIDFKPIKPLRTSIRLDGNFYYYKGLDDRLFADIPMSNQTMSDGQPYQYVGYYRGSNGTSTGYTANASVSNGAISKQVNLNATITTHLPKLRMIVALRFECSLYHYRRALSELEDGPRGIVLDDRSDYFGTPYDGKTENQFVALYPEYYSTWENPQELIPFAERFLWARDNDATLYSDLSKLVVRSNYAYTMNPNRISAFYSANLSVTKEIGNHFSVSFYANNFFNTMRKARSSQTNLETSLFASTYVPTFYYGLSLKIKW